MCASWVCASSLPGTEGHVCKWVRGSGIVWVFISASDSILSECWSLFVCCHANLKQIKMHKTRVTIQFSHDPFHPSALQAPPWVARAWHRRRRRRTARGRTPDRPRHRGEVSKRRYSQRGEEKTAWSPPPVTMASEAVMELTPSCPFPLLHSLLSTTLADWGIPSLSTLAGPRSGISIRNLRQLKDAVVSGGSCNRPKCFSKDVKKILYEATTVCDRVWMHKKYIDCNIKYA